MNIELLLNHSVDIVLIILAIGWVIGNIIDKLLKQEYEISEEEDEETFGDGKV